MDYLAEPPRRLFCCTVCAYKRPDLSDEDYHKYMSQVHGPLVKDLMVKYGIVKWSMVSSYKPHSPQSSRHFPLLPIPSSSPSHTPLNKSLTHPPHKSHNTPETRNLMSQIAGPQFANMADYDCIVSACFNDIDDFVRMKADPYYKEKVMPDHENFADTKRSK